MPQSPLDALLAKHGGTVEPPAEAPSIDALLSKYGAVVDPPPAPAPAPRPVAPTRPAPMKAYGVTDPNSVRITSGATLRPAPSRLTDLFRRAKASVQRMFEGAMTPLLPESFVTSATGYFDEIENGLVGRPRPAAPVRIGEDQPEMDADPVGDAMARGFTHGAAEGTLQLARGMSNPLNIGLTALGIGEVAILRRLASVARDIPKIEQAIVAAQELKATGQLGELSKELVSSVERLRDLERLRFATRTAQAATGGAFTLEGAYNLVTAPTWTERAMATAQMAGGAAMALTGTAGARSARAGASEAAGFAKAAREATQPEGRVTPDASDIVVQPPRAQLPGTVEPSPTIPRIAPTAPRPTPTPLDALAAKHGGVIDPAPAAPVPTPTVAAPPPAPVAAPVAQAPRVEPSGDTAPLRLYHGTDTDFDAFDRSEDIGFHLGSRETATKRIESGEMQESGRIVAADVIIKNPLRLPDLHTWSPKNVLSALEDAGVLTEEQGDAIDLVDRETIAPFLEAKGYDGIVYANETEGGGDSYIALRPEQIKIVGREPYQRADSAVASIPASKAGDIGSSPVQPAIDAAVTKHGGEIVETASAPAPQPASAPAPAATAPRERFLASYTSALTAAIQKNPAGYAYPAKQAPTVAAKMADALARGTANVNSPALKAAAKELGITKPNVSGWKAFFAEKAAAPVATPQVPNEPGTKYVLPSFVTAGVAKGQEPDAVPVREANEGSRYAGENLDDLLPTTEAEQGDRFEAIAELTGQIAKTTSAATRTRLTAERDALQAEYDGTYSEVSDAAGDAEAQAMRARVEQPAPPVASKAEEAQNEPDGPVAAAPRDRDALAGTPPVDGAEPRAVGAPEGRDRAGGQPDGGRGERGDSERDAGARSAGAVPGRVGVPAKRDGRADPAGRPQPRDFRLTATDDVAVGGPKQRVTQNLAAIKTLQTLEAENRPATLEEQQALAKYVGWGGLSNAFNDKHKDYSPELRELLTDTEYEAARASTPNAHYTSLPVISAMYDGLTRLGVTGALRVLEPAAGIGHFLGMMPEALAAHASRHAVELDPISGRITAALYPTAKVHVGGFQDATLPEGAFDLVISNVPFGNYQVADKAFKGRPKPLTSAIHNYYFAKALDLTRPGGIVAFITSHYTLDAKSAVVREYLADRATLVGAIRLPNTAFKANAGTEVVTDIILLQKKAAVDPSGRARWVSSELAGLDGGHHINKYFIDHPEMVLGRHSNTGSMHSDNEYTVEPTGDLAEQLREAVNRLPLNVYTPPTTAATSPTKEQRLPAAAVTVPPGVREGAWFQDASGQLYIRERGNAVAITDLSKAEVGRVKGLLEVRDALRATMRTMLTPDASDKAIKEAQKVLNRTYDAFVRVHGYIAKRANYLALREDPDVYTLLALEEWKPKADTPEKAAIFSKRTLQPHVPVESVDTPKEALLVALNETGRVDWRRMAALTGQPEADLQAALEGLVYHDPGTGTWEQADRYLSGNVKAKLAAAKAAAKTDPKYAPNVTALEKVQPADLEPTDIAVRLGSPWVPPDVIEDFAAHLGLKGLRFRYSPALAKWSMDDGRFYGRQSVQNTTQWGTERKPATSLLAASLNLGDPLVYDTINDNGKERQVVNQKETIAAREKQEAIAQEFRSWVWEQPERATRLSTIYNETMNTMRLWEPDGAHLTLPGTNPAITFRPHQKNFIWRGLQQPNALAHHVVGAGKTFAGIALAMEKRRMGLARKPMVVVPNHLVQQWARDVLRLYPAARVLASTKKDFEPGNRKRFLNRIATGDWDFVIVPMSHFGMIEVGAETFDAHVRRELAGYADELRRAREEAGKNDPSVKELEKAKLNLEAKLRTTKERQKKDEDVITFEQLGVDMLVVDEAHNYKKLGFPTKMTRVAGVPAGPGSQRAFDLVVKSGYLTKANPTGGTVFLTGTPISNTMAEMFVLMRYLAQSALDERGIPQFDGWAATFGEKVTAFEISPTGRGFRQKTRFAKFTNLPELVQMYRAFADVQTADMLKLPTPPLKGGKAEVHTVAASPDLDAYVEELLERFAAVLGMDGRQKPDPRVDNPLKITTDGRKAALDLRLVGLEQPAGGKVDQVAERLHAIWTRTKKAKGTQLVFADLGTPSDRTKVVDVGEFTVYDALRDRLVELGIPRDQVRFIQEANTDARKQALFDAVNAGDVRVLIGSSETMGAGMNVQERLVALHHMDAPWRPSDIEQREGRILRQGNKFVEKGADLYDPDFEVEIHTYVTERSFDAYLWQLLENKARFIRQALKGDLTSRETDDADDVVLNFAQAKGAASGNPAIMEHAKTQSDVQRLEASEANHGRRRWRLQRELASLPEQVALAERRLADTQALVDAIAMPADRKDFAITIGGKTLQGKEAAEAIAAKFEQSRTGSRRQLDGYHFSTKEVAIGRAAGVEVRGYYAISNVYDPPNVVAKWVIAAGDAMMEKNAATGPGALNSLAIFLENDPKKTLDRQTQELATLQSSLSVARAEVAKPFVGEEKLNGLRARLKELEQLLNLDAKSQQAEAAQAGTIVQTAEEERADRSAEREDDGGDVAEDLGAWSEAAERPASRGGGVSGDASVGKYTAAEPKAGHVPPGVRSGGVSNINPIEFPELVDFARALQKVPGIAAQFRKAEKRGEFRGMQGIRLAADLFKAGNEYQLAKTLAHEIGHLVDWLPHATLKRGNLLGRLQSLHRFLKHTFTAPDGSTISNKDIKAELIAFSAKWRPWEREDAPPGMVRYRDSARELYADALSGLLVDPGLLEHQAPTFHRLFFELLDKKPDVRDAYFDLQEVLAGTPEELVARRRSGVRRMFEEGDVKALELERRRIAELKQRGKDLWFRLKTQLVDRNYAVIDRRNALVKRGVRLHPDEDPVYLLEERNYLGAELKAFTEKNFAPIFKRLSEEEISWNAFGEALFYERIIAGDRSELANPRGLSPAHAGELYESLKAELGGARARVLREEAVKFRAVVKGVAERAHDAGLYTDELYDQMKKNPAYVTFQVIDHLESGVTSRVHKQIGTLKDIVNPADSTILKTLVTLRAIEHNDVKRGVVDFLRSHFPADIAPAKTVWSGKGHRPIDPKDDQQRLITFFEKGKLTGVYVDRYMAETINNDSVGQNFAVVSLLRLVNTGVFRPVFTTFNLGFQGFNFFRDFGRFWKNVPNMTVGRALRRYVEALPLARLRAFGLPDTPTAKQLQAYKDLLDAEESRMLGVTFNDLLANREVEDTQIEDILKRTGVPGFQVTPKHPWARPLRVLLEWIKEVGDFIEALPKAAGIYEFKGTGTIADIPASQRSFIRRKVGSPDFLAGGTWKPVSNEFFLFSNAITQAMRSDLEVATEPTTRAGFWWKTARVNLLPKLLVFAATLGVFGETLRRLYGRVTEYDATNYLPIVLGEDADGNTIYARLPQDDSGRLIGGLFWKLLQSIRGDREALASLSQVLDYTAGQAPGLTPTITAASEIAQFAAGQNPYDAFRGRNVFTEDEWKARDSTTLRKFIGYEFQNLGGGIVWKFYPGEPRPRSVTTGQRILELPVLSNIGGRFIRITNYGETEDYRRVAGRVQRDDARGRQAERAAIGRVIRDFQALPSAQRGAPTQAVIAASAKIAAELYKGDPVEARRRAPQIRQMLQLGLLRSESDPLIDALLSATPKEKLAIVQRALETGRLPRAAAP